MSEPFSSVDSFNEHGEPIDGRLADENCRLTELGVEGNGFYLHADGGCLSLCSSTAGVVSEIKDSEFRAWESFLIYTELGTLGAFYALATCHGRWMLACTTLGRITREARKHLVGAFFTRACEAMETPSAVAAKMLEGVK